MARSRISAPEPGERGSASNVVPLATAGPSSPGRAAREVDHVHEIILDGRLYRLVAVGEERHEPQRPVEAPPSAPARGSASQHRSAAAAMLLTERELQVAALVREGMVNKEIADKLQISEWTVSTHLRRIFAKLGVDRRAAMVSKCIAMLDEGH